MNGIVLNNALKSTLLSLQKTSNLIDDVTLRLASGKKVNSALDNPQNFFTASALNDTASDYSRLLNGISQSIRAVEQASNGLESISELIDQAESLALDRQAEIEAVDRRQPLDGESGLSNLITEKGADFYFQLDDASGGVTDDGDIGTNGTYSASVQRQADPLFEGSNGSAYFNGVDSFVNIGYNAALSGNFTQKTIELVFNAGTTSGRQTIYSQGNATRGIDIYIDDKELYITAVNSPFFGGGTPINQPIFQTTIESGRNYHVGLVFSSEENRLEAYVNGLSIGSSEVGSGTFFGHSGPTFGRQNVLSKNLHDGVSNDLNYFDGLISDVAIHNTILTDDEIAEHAAAAEANNFNSSSEAYTNTIEQIRRLAIDSNYRNFDLLRGKEIRTDFSPNTNSFLIIEGVDIASRAQGLPPIGFDDTDDLNIIIDQLDELRTTVRNFINTLTSDLNTIKTRQTFTQNIINTLKAGEDDLTLADKNQDGASLLALQTRQQLSITALSLAAQSTQQTLRLF